MDAKWVVFSVAYINRKCQTRVDAREAVVRNDKDIKDLIDGFNAEISAGGNVVCDQILTVLDKPVEVEKKREFVGFKEDAMECG